MKILINCTVQEGGIWLGKNVSLRWIMVGEIVGWGKRCVPRDGGRDGVKEKTFQKKICG
jgi:hypothetical protein